MTEIVDTKLWLWHINKNASFCLALKYVKRIITEYRKCSPKYIGETSWNLKKRIYEHKTRDLKLNNTFNVYVCH